MENEEIIIGDWRVDAPDYSQGKRRLYLGTNINDQRRAILRRFDKEGQAENEASILRKAKGAVDTPLLDIVEYDGKRWLVREYLRGPTLLEVLVITNRDRVFRQSAPIFLKMAERVRNLHSDGIIHGDIKPGHLVWDNDADTFRLIDYGASRFMEDPEPGPLRGTEGYTAPEVLAGAVSPSCDVFSLGMVAGVMLMGKPAHELARDMPIVIHDPEVVQDRAFIMLVHEMTDPLYTARPNMEEVVSRLEGMNLSPAVPSRDSSYSGKSDSEEGIGCWVVSVILGIILIALKISSC